MTFPRQAIRTGHFAAIRPVWFTQSCEVPAHTLFDLAVYYSPSRSNVQLALNTNNVLNATCRIGAQNYLRLFPGAPRTTNLTLTYRF